MADIELLAPAGTVETYHAALDGGADAVYLGAPGFNARNLAKDLTIEEITAMIDHCHSLGKKLYIAANSLILEKELESVIEKLALLQELGPDALLVQDLGLVHLVRNYFPRLKLHGSTLMTVHNSDGVHYLGDQGFERVVLARELTLKEIETIAVKAGPTELEVFIHGAMCFSYSGLCLFSSYLGGKSGLRGRCVQPCRRAYSSGEKKARGGRKGAEQNKYLFSMNDLNGLTAIPRLKELGISSLKIEGRLRSAHYVRSVVEAYRLVLDAGEDSGEAALNRAQQLVDKSMSRKTSPGFFFSPQPVEAISPFHSGNMGIHLGRFSKVNTVGGQATCKFTIKNDLELGDRLRLHVEPSGERTAFRVKSLFVTGSEQKRATAGEKVSMELPKNFSLVPGARVEVYRIDGASRSMDTANLVNTRGVRERLQKLRRKLARYVGEVVEATCFEESSPEITPSPARPFRNRSKQKTAKKKIGIEWWLKTDSIKMVLGRLPFTPDRYLLSFEKQLLSEVGKIRSVLGRRSRLVTWALPPLIMENDLRRVKKQIAVLLGSGFRSFQISHVSQIQLFKGEKVFLYGDYTLNLVNSQAAAHLAGSGVVMAQAGIELDRPSLQQLLAGCRGSSHPAIPAPSTTPLGLYVYGAPPLYTARLASTHLQYERQIQSPRKEPYVVRKKEGFTQTFPEKPFSLLPYLEELKSSGVSYVVVDICGHSSKKEMEDLTERLGGTGRYAKLPTFNYLGNLE